MDKWVPMSCMLISAVLASAAYFLWTTQMSNASDIITTGVSEEVATGGTEDAKNNINSDSEAIKPEEKIKILIVPGHDAEDYGAKYKNLTEEEINLQLADRLHDLLSEEERFEVFIARDSGDYTDQLSEYFETQKEEIIGFIQKHKKRTSDLIESSLYEPVRVVEHNKVPKDVALRLYGINKWVNENEIDLVFHIHFNDYPRKKEEVFEYSGFSIYIPSENMTGYKKSRELGISIRKNLSEHFKESNLPVEKDIVIENSELISVGSNNTLKNSIPILVEYGYIYEDQFYNKENRSESLETAAYQTYLSIKDLF